jgi:hypothetical protein
MLLFACGPVIAKSEIVEDNSSGLAIEDNNSSNIVNDGRSSVISDPNAGIEGDKSKRLSGINLPKISIEEIEGGFSFIPRIAIGGAYYTHNDWLYEGLRDTFLPSVEVGISISRGNWFFDIYKSVSENGYKEWYSQPSGSIEGTEFRYKDSAITIGYMCGKSSFCEDISHLLGKKGNVSLFSGYRKGTIHLKKPYPITTNEVTLGEIIVDTDLKIKGPFIGVGYTYELSRYTIFGMNFAWQGKLRGSYSSVLTVPGSSSKASGERRIDGSSDQNDTNSYRIGASLSGDVPLFKGVSYAIACDYYKFSLHVNEQPEDGTTSFGIKNSRFGVSFSLNYVFF